MRKLVDTLVLVILLVGPAVVLTCVRQPDISNEKMSKVDLPRNNLNSTLAYDDSDVYIGIRP